MKRSPAFEQIESRTFCWDVEYAVMSVAAAHTIDWRRATAPRAQLREAMARFDLQRIAQPFTRCLSCNGLLQVATPDEVKDQVPENAARFYSEFWRCTSCNKVHWQGSHYQRMTRLIEETQQ